ncbi:MAG TPA: hypothetical protein VGO86_04430 [Candidatus Dormibacteraeota bacterium]
MRSHSSGAPAARPVARPSQQDRKTQEREVVRRLTIGAGAAALGMAGYFTVASATSAPVAFGAPAGDAHPGALMGGDPLNDKVFIRKVHVAAPRPAAGGVVASAASRAQGGAAPVAGGAPQAQVAAASVASPQPPAATPRPTPVATTGGTKPVK